MMVPVLIIAFAVFTVCLAKQDKVAVHLEANRRKCFMEEMTAGTVLMSIHAAINT